MSYSNKPDHERLRTTIVHRNRWRCTIGPLSLNVGRLTNRPNILRCATVVLLLMLGSCGTKRSTYEITGSRWERVTAVSRIIAKHHALPTPILDAQFVEEQIGDGRLGPSDFRAFYFIEVAPQEVVQWTQILTPLSETPEYEKPMKAHSWWIASNASGSLKFYKPDILTGRTNGWIGVSPKTGRIYFFTFTQ